MTESIASDYALSPCERIAKEAGGEANSSVFDPDQLLQKLTLSAGSAAYSDNGTNRSQR